MYHALIRALEKMLPHWCVHSKTLRSVPLRFLQRDTQLFEQHSLLRSCDVWSFTCCQPNISAKSYLVQCSFFQARSTASTRCHRLLVEGDDSPTSPPPQTLSWKHDILREGQKKAERKRKRWWHG